MEKLEKYLKKIDHSIENGKYKDTWESLATYQVPNSYKNYKLGVFFHWGIYSVPEHMNEWYARNMYLKGNVNFDYHVEQYGEHKDFGYKDLIPMFKAEKFNPEQWMDLVDSIGAKYFVPVAEHHDGFQMYDSELSIWNSKNMGPKIDVMDELANVATKRNIEFGLSSHRIEHLFFCEGGLDFESDIKNPEYGHIYWPTIRETEIDDNPEVAKLFFEDWLVRSCELVDKFCPKVFYFDWWIEDQRVKPYLRKFLAYYYNACEENGFAGVVNYKYDAIPYGLGVRDMERGHFSSIQPDYWQTCTSGAVNAWSYEVHNQFKKPIEVINNFIDIIAKNGNLLINAGPKADGTFDQREVELFKNVGTWVKTNDEAIFSTRVWKIFGEGPTNNVEGHFSEGKQSLDYKATDFRFTCNANHIYIFVMNPQVETVFRINSLAFTDSKLKRKGEIENITCLDSNYEVVNWKRHEDFCEVNISATSELPIVLKVTLL